MRSALVYWGRKNIPSDLHSVVDGRVVTWDEVMAARRARQVDRLWTKREWLVRPLRAWKVWVAYYDMPLMGGWQAFIEHYRPGFGFGLVWIDRDRRWLKEILMKAFPLVLPLGKDWEQWEEWKIAFAKEFQRRRHDKRPLGVAYVWWDGRDEFKPIQGC